MRHKLTGKGVEPDPSKVEAIKEMPRPADKAAVQGFLGMCHYLRNFLSEPVRNGPTRHWDLTKQDAVFVWSDTHENAFNSAKELITSGLFEEHHSQCRYAKFCRSRHPGCLHQ